MAVNPANATAAPQITGAVQQAAESSGISFEYLLTTAQIESNLNPGAQASTSSAKGLYQFIDQTWLGTLKTSGAANGYGRYADAIARSSDGHYEVADPGMRAAIMQLRSDPSASAAMAGAFTRSNADQLQAAIGRPPTEGELYIAHFLGSDGASRLINAATAQPRASAADMFPQAAAANRGIFFDGAGHARSASDVYAKLTGRFDVARANRFAPEAASKPLPHHRHRRHHPRPRGRSMPEPSRRHCPIPPASRKLMPWRAPICRRRSRATAGRCSNRCSPTARARR
jgi:hypothetical protein